MRRLVKRGDRGAVAPLTALAMIGLIVIAAIVVDLGQERAMRRDAQAVADLAALAGAQAMTLPSGTSPVAGCEKAVSYLKINISKLPDATSVNCSNFANVVCNANTGAITAADGGTGGDYSIEITWPVPDSEIADSKVPGGLRDFDGWHDNDQCDRLRVSIELRHDGFFSGVVGDGELATGASAVARRLPYTDTRTPNLWLLEPHGCSLLVSSGGANVMVGTVDAGLVTASGLITADSDAQACSNAQDWIIDSNGGGSIYAIPNTDPSYANTLQLDPPGEISVYGMALGQVGCISGAQESAGLGEASVCDPSDVPIKLNPVPTRRPLRATRAPVDWAFNCKDDYPEYRSTSSGAGGITLTPCPGAENSVSFIEEVFDAVDQFDLTQAGGAWNLFTDYSGGRCAWNSNDGELILPAGNFVVNCPNGLKVNGGKIAFTGGNVILAGGLEVGSGTIVFNGDATLDGNGRATTVIPSATPQTGLPGDGDCVKGNGLFHPTCFNKPSKTAAFVYQRKGGVKMSSAGNLVANHAAWIQDHRYNTNSTTNDFNVTGGFVNWTPPDAGPFRALSLWSESGWGENETYAMAGQAKFDLAGVFFTPEAEPFKLAGGGAFKPQTAQFISRKLEVTGGGTLELSPAGLELIDIPPPAAVLIR